MLNYCAGNLNQNIFSVAGGDQELISGGWQRLSARAWMAVLRQGWCAGGADCLQLLLNGIREVIKII